MLEDSISDNRPWNYIVLQKFQNFRALLQQMFGSAPVAWMIEAKDQGHNFSELWLANFPKFLEQNSLKYCIFEGNSKIVVCKIIVNVILKFYSLAADVDYVL